MKSCQQKCFGGALLGFGDNAVGGLMRCDVSITVHRGFDQMCQVLLTI